MEQEELEKKGLVSFKKKKYIKPEIKSDTIYETKALGCGQCLNEGPATNVGFEAGCGVSVSNY